VALRKPLVSLGRAAQNDVVLDDPMIAQTVASLVRKGDGFQLTSTDARAGDFQVNGRRTRSAAVGTGDRVQIGSWQLTLLEGEPSGTKTGSGDAPAVMSLTDLEALVALSTDMMRDTTPARLFQALLTGLVKLTRAEKGFIIVLKDGTRHLAASHNVRDEALDLGKVSDTVIDQVIEHLSPLIVSDALHDQRFGRARSVVDLKLSSVMCVPMIYRKDLLGVVYLGNDTVTDLFTERDLALLKIYAAQASLIVHHALLVNQLQLDNKNLRTQLEHQSQGEMIGTCAPMKRMFQVLRRVAPTDVSILVLGETGTGKELVARELHKLSNRRNGPFVAINCGAIPENLLESELFGHRRGSFTGAVSDKVGKLEAAHGGTLFLDEIGEMPMNLQVKLLRVLQDRVIERVGDLAGRAVDIRVVAATNKDLAERIRTGAFREDLFYRLNDISVTLPPLRDREEDVVVLARYFLARAREQYGNSRVQGFTNQAFGAMRAYAWPGNVRELEARVKKAVIMSDRPLLNPDDLGMDADPRREIVSLAEATEEWKTTYVRKVLEMNGGNKAQTARDLDVDARTIFRYVEKMEESGGA
jgi:transcriptional regulator with GAF, ATPase, and Fis domain